ncbi:MAG: helix-turn-helix transcriptional regulator [Leptolyngbyaceae cyanobacterium bins.302]|nr:helix-turn-helix transcriptional regulator [Leptolyngbyaceae cyanobacterium bins.302]
MSLIEYIGRRIRDLRTNYGGGEGLSQEALAKALGIAANTISRWETATYRPTIEDLEKLARFFGVSILSFFPPEEMQANQANEQAIALLRAAEQLPPEDLEELRRYAEFRKARSLQKQAEQSKSGRKRKLAE